MTPLRVESPLDHNHNHEHTVSCYQMTLSLLDSELGIYICYLLRAMLNNVTSIAHSYANVNRSEARKRGNLPYRSISKEALSSCATFRSMGDVE